MISPALRERLDGSHLYAVEGGGVVFDARLRQLFALNPTAAFIWLSLSQNLPRDDLQQSFQAAFGTDREAAGTAITDALVTFDRLENRVDPASGPSFPSRSLLRLPDEKPATYRFMDSLVTIFAPAVAAKLVDDLLSGMKIESDAPASTGLTIVAEATDGGFSIRSNYDGRQVVAQSSLVCEIERIVVQHSVRATPHLLTFHAGCLSLSDHSILLSGPSGSGKTTLSAVLANRGWHYGSDELTMVAPDMSWLPVPIPPCVKKENFERIARWYPDLPGVRSHERYGNTVKYLPLAATARPHGVRTVVYPTYKVSATGAEFSELAPLDGLSRLLGQCVHMTDAFDRTGVESLLGWHERTRYLGVTFQDVEAAATILEREVATGC